MCEQTKKSAVKVGMHSWQALVPGCHTAYLGLPASDRAAHDEAMPPDPSIPLGPYPLDLDILKASLGEPLQQVRTVNT